MLSYNPSDWYWLKQDGTIYSSARRQEHDASDAGYEAWVSQGNTPTPYPTDLDGADSEPELAAVLAVYGLTVWEPDAKAEAIGRLSVSCSAAIVGGYVSSALGEPHTYPSNITDQINMMGSVTASLLPLLDHEWKTPFWCRDEAGTWAFRDHTQQQIQTAGSDGKAHIVACQGSLMALTALVMAADPAADLSKIVWPTQA